MGRDLAAGLVPTSDPYRFVCAQEKQVALDQVPESKCFGNMQLVELFIIFERVREFMFRMWPCSYSGYGFVQLHQH